MKLENDFDLIDALDDFNERFGVLKVLRKKRKYIYTVFSIYTLILLGNINKFTTLRSIIISILMELSFLAGYYILPDLIAKKVTKVDLYYLTAFIELCELIKKLNDLYLETDLELISKSTLYKKTYKETYKIIKNNPVLFILAIIASVIIIGNFYYQ